MTGALLGKTRNTITNASIIANPHIIDGIALVVVGSMILKKAVGTIKAK